MNIESITNNSSAFFNTVQKDPSQKPDAISENLKKQIENIKEQIGSLSENDSMTSEDKMKKRQELQSMIQDLNSQLAQRRVDILKEAQEKKIMEAENALAKTAPPQKTDTVSLSGPGLSAITMQNILRAEVSISQAATVNAVKTGMKGQQGVLAGEIKADRSRGVDSAAKSAQLSSIQGKISLASIDIAGDLSDINGDFRKAQESNLTEKTDDSDKSKNTEDLLKKVKDPDENDINDLDKKENTKLYPYEPVDLFI